MELNISLYTIFLVWLVSPIPISTLIFWYEVILDRATYNWPCENTGWGKYIPTLSKDCPCDLLIVIENATLTGNWRRFRLKGNLLSDGVNVIRGINTCLPICDPVIISALMTLLWNPWQINLVPLQRPSDGFKFHKSMIGIPSFSFNSPGGSSGIFNDLRNSGE